MRCATKLDMALHLAERQEAAKQAGSSHLTSMSLVEATLYLLRCQHVVQRGDKLSSRQSVPATLSTSLSLVQALL